MGHALFCEARTARAAPEARNNQNRGRVRREAPHGMAAMIEKRAPVFTNN